MPNAKDFVQGSEKILAVGTTGGGKTTGFLSLPGQKFIYIFDPNALNTLKGHDIDYEAFMPDILNLNAVALKAGVMDKGGKPDEPKTYVEWELDFEKKIREGFFDNYDVIGFDSMTTFSSMVMDRIMFINNRFGKWPEQADWTATMNTIQNVMRTLTSIQGKTIYVTAHIELKEDKTTGKIMNSLNLIGRLRNSLPLLFSEVWSFSAEQDAQKKTQFQVQTQPDRYSPYLRCTIKGLDSLENVTIPEVNWNNPVGFGLSKLLNKVNVNKK